MIGAWKLWGVLALSALAGIVMTACGSSSAAAPAPSPATTNVTLSDPAACVAPSGPYSHVYITVTDVEASTDANATSGFEDLTPSLKSKPIQIDLLGQPANQCFLATLGSTTELQPGDYQQIRVILADNATAGSIANNQCGSAGANCVVLNNGQVEMLNLSSEAKTGIKIPAGQIAGGKFTVSAGQTKDLNVDFNTCSSIVVQGNGQYRLKPVLHAGEVSTTSTSINGTVVDKATGQPVNGTTMVALEQKDSSGVDRLLMATVADSSGKFVFCPLPAGSYDVVATAIGTNNTIYAATVTTGVSNGSSLGTVPLIAAAAPASATGEITTSTGTAAAAADVSLSALQTATVAGASQIFTMPLVEQSSGTASLATAAGATCPANTDCVNFTLALPAAPANAGAFSASGTSYTQPSGATADYTLEADAFVPSSGGTPDCNPATQSTSKDNTQATLTLGPGISLQAATLAFTGCQ